jgi:hypothetical protein
MFVVQVKAAEQIMMEPEFATFPEAETYAELLAAQGQRFGNFEYDEGNDKWSCGTLSITIQIIEE